MDEWTPIPEERGSLNPPGRRPPTAVGVATPPPPHRRRSEHVSPSWRRRFRPRAVVGMLVTLAAGATIGTALSATAAMTVATGLGTVLLGCQVRRRRSRRQWTRYQAAIARAG